MDASDLMALNSERRARKAVVQVTDLASGKSDLLLEGELVDGSLGEAVADRFRSGKSGVVEADGRSFFVNAYLPPVRIVVIGAVHISQVLANMAALAGFDIRIIDPRTAFATPERFAGVDLVADWPVDVLGDQPLDRYTALVAVTHDPKIDDYPIGQALQAGCFYVGALGSRKTHAARLERLKKAGLDDLELARIRAPIGLAIKAANPAEIAVAILAEIIQSLRTREHILPARSGP